MGQLVDDLLTYARVGRTTSREPVACGELVEQALASLSVRIAESDARVIVAPLPVVHADASRLGQLFQNLVANALKFHRPDVPPVVRVRGELVPAATGDPIETFGAARQTNGESWLGRVTVVGFGYTTPNPGSPSK